MLLGNNNRGGLNIDMGYIRNTSPNRNGHRKSSMIEVRQPTGGADANGGAVRTMPMSRACRIVVYGMPGTSDRSARDTISKPLQQQTMKIMQPRDTPLHINHLPRY